MQRLNNLDIFMLVLLIIGGINWGLIGLLNFDLVATLFGVLSVFSRIVYSLVGLSSLYACYIIYKLNL
jgi:uncharacterized membrane protein YuzA (DUF378 family)